MSLNLARAKAAQERMRWSMVSGSSLQNLHRGDGASFIWCRCLLMGPCPVRISAGISESNFSQFSLKSEGISLMKRSGLFLWEEAV